MSNEKQTAVEWFLDQLIEHRIIIVDKTTYQVKYKHQILLEQAKEMEKEQIMEAHYAPKYGCFSEDYYEKTYGGNK
jgi:hypothetical protein